MNYEPLPHVLTANFPGGACALYYSWRRPPGTASLAEQKWNLLTKTITKRFGGTRGAGIIIILRRPTPRDKREKGTLKFASLGELSGERFSGNTAGSFREKERVVPGIQARASLRLLPPALSLLRCGGGVVEIAHFWSVDLHSAIIHSRTTPFIKISAPPRAPKDPLVKMNETPQIYTFRRSAKEVSFHFSDEKRISLSIVWVESFGVAYE